MSIETQSYVTVIDLRPSAIDLHNLPILPGAIILLASFVIWLAIIRSIRNPRKR